MQNSGQLTCNLDTCCTSVYRLSKKIHCRREQDDIHAKNTIMSAYSSIVQLYCKCNMWTHLTELDQVKLVTGNTARQRTANE